MKAVCVTLDERGCAAYWLDEAGELVERIVPRIPIEHVVDTTGAGDSFAAGLAFGYLQGADVVRAAQYGNAMGAQRCTGSTLDVYLPLSADRTSSSPTPTAPSSRADVRVSARTTTLR